MSNNPSQSSQNEQLTGIWLRSPNIPADRQTNIEHRLAGFSRCGPKLASFLQYSARPHRSPERRQQEKNWLRSPKTLPGDPPPATLPGSPHSATAPKLGLVSPKPDPATRFRPTSQAHQPRTGPKLGLFPQNPVRRPAFGPPPRLTPLRAGFWGNEPNSGQGRSG